MANRRGRGRRPPPQQPEAAVMSDSDGDDIVALDQAPAHLQAPRPPTPIMVLSDSDSDDDGIVPIRHLLDSPVTPTPHPGHRKRRSSVTVDDAAAVKRTRFEDSPPAGPSTTHTTNPPALEPILPRADYLVPSVLEVIPDLCPVWAAQQLEALIKQLHSTTNVPGQLAVQRTIEMAFEMESYPRPQDDNQPEEKGDYSEITYRPYHRRGLEYGSRSIELLQDIFSTVPLPYIREVFATDGHRLLVPTYNVLHKQSTSADKPYQELKRKRHRKGKQRAEAAVADPASDSDSQSSQSVINPGGVVEFNRENNYLQELMRLSAQKELEQVMQQKANEDEQKRKEAAKEAAVARGDAIECGCCFDKEAPEEGVSCPEGHLFCKDCLRSLVENKLGDQQTVIKCMDMSGCTAEYTERMIAAAVSTKTMSLYQRLRQLKDLEMAAIEGLETCPFCPFAIVIDNEHEKLFRCQNEECKKVTCRNCKRPDHIPKRCEEVEADLKLNSRHAIEEAMSEALVRKCPHCAKPYIKMDGCNKMTCSACGKMSCFVCRKAITNYEHFDGHGRGSRRPTGTKCPLYDVNEARTEAERIRLARDEAQRRAMAEATNSGVAVDEADLAVDAPEIPAARNAAQVHYHFHPGMAAAGLGERLQALNRVILDANGAMAGVAVNFAAPPGWGNQAPDRNAQAADELRRADVLRRADELRLQLLDRIGHPDRPPAPPQAARGRRGAPAQPAQLAAPLPAQAPVGGRGRRAHGHAPAPAAPPPPLPVALGFPPLPPPPAPIGYVRPGEFAARLEAWRQDVRQNGAARAQYPLPHQPPRYP